MKLLSLSIHHLRNLNKVVLEPGPRLNLIYGPNGSGKSSVLEAIYLLGRGKSFRSAYSRRIVQNSFTELTVYAKSQDASGIPHSLGIQIKDGRFRARTDGKYLQKSSDLANLMPLLLITPDGDRLIKGSPRQRRRFLDWGLFHVEPGYLGLWQQYNRLLQQRNSLLRQRKPDLLTAWDTQLVQAALKLDKCRRDFVAQLTSHSELIFQRLIGESILEYDYHAGWPASAPEYADALHETINSDIRAGFTQRGPHRADLVLQTGGRPAAEYLSGGQQKLVAAALLLAQAKLLNQATNKTGLILVDDLPAELDKRHRRAFMDILYETGGQVFVTATDAQRLEEIPYQEIKLFHVEQGKLSP